MHVEGAAMSRDTDHRFAAFVDRESTELLRAAWYLTGTQEEARDLVQEALVRVFPRWDRLRAGEELGYVRRTMVNLQRDEWRRRSRARVLPWHRAAGMGGGQPAPDPAAVVTERSTLAAQLQQLPARQREVLVLRHACDLSEQQVADQLGISVGAVKSAASRGAARLRELSSPGPTAADRAHPVPHERGRHSTGTQHETDEQREAAR